MDILVIHSLYIPHIFPRYVPYIFPCVFLNLWSQEKTSPYRKTTFLFLIGQILNVLYFSNNFMFFVKMFFKQNRTFWAHKGPYGPIWDPTRAIFWEFIFCLTKAFNNNNNNNHSNNNNSHGSKRPKYNPMQHPNQMNGAMGLMGGMQPQYGYQASYGGGYYQPRGQPVQNFYSMPPQYPPTQMYQQAVVPPPLPGMNIGMNMMQGAPPGMVLPPGMPPPLLGGGFMQTLPPSQPYINNMQYQPPPQGMNSVQKLPTSDNNNVANNNKNNIGETKPSSISPIPPVLNTISSSSNNLPPPGLLTQGLPPGLTPPTLPPFAPPPNNNNFIQNNTSINSTVSPNIIVHQNDNINTTTANNSNKNSPVPPSTSSTTISTSNVVEITTKATKKKKKKSNVHILFKSENNMSMEEMRALAWKKNKLLSKLQ